MHDHLLYVTISHKQPLIKKTKIFPVKPYTPGGGGGVYFVIRG